MQRGVTAGDWWPAAVIMVLVIVLVMWPALRPATPGAARQRRGRQAVLATAAMAGLDAALIALGVLAFWELRRYSAVPRLSGGSLGIDPVLAVAPVLALAGIALLPLRLLPAAARLLDRASAHGKRLATALASWQVSRRPVREGGPILLVVLAVATGTLVLAQHQSWRQSQLDQAAFTTGADVRVSLAAPLPLGRAASVARARGVVAATPVSAFDNGFSVYALGAAKAADTVLLRPDLSPQPVTALWHRITPPASGAGLLLPGRPARLDITAMLSPPRGVHLGAMSASLSVQDGSGIVYSVPAGNLPADGRDHQLTAGLTGGQVRYPLRLLGISLSYQLPGFPPFPQPSKAAQRAANRTKLREAKARATLAIRALAVSAHTSGGFPAPFAQASTLIRWAASATSPGLANPAAAGIPPAVTAWRLSAGAAALTFKVGAGHVVQRQGSPPLPVPGQLAIIGAHPALPVPGIATHAFFSAASAHTGEIVQVPVGNATVPVRLVAEVRAFPTAGADGPAVIVDQAWLQQVLVSEQQPPLPVSQWWLQTVQHGVPAQLPAGATVATSAGSAARLLSDPLPNVPQLSLLVIVIAAGLLAGIGFVVSVVAAVREQPAPGRASRGARCGPGCPGGPAVPGTADAQPAGRGRGRGDRGSACPPAGSRRHPDDRSDRGVPAGAGGDPAGLDCAAGTGHRGRARPRRGGGRHLPPRPSSPAPGRRVRMKRAAPETPQAKPSLSSVTGTGAAASLALAMLVLVCTFVAVAVPRASLDYRTQALQRTFRSVSSAQTAVVADADIVGLTGSYLTAADMAAARGTLAAGLHHEGLPLAPAAAQWAGLDTGSSSFSGGRPPFTGAAPVLELMYRDRLGSGTALVAGSLPTSVTKHGKTDTFGVAVTAATAAKFGLHTGTQLRMSGLGLVVTGIVRPRDPASSLWTVDPFAAAPELIQTGGSRPRRTGAAPRSSAEPSLPPCNKTWAMGRCTRYGASRSAWAPSTPTRPRAAA